MLRDAPHLYRLAAVSKDKPERAQMLKEFNLLRSKLGRARIFVRCGAEGCGRTARWMTLPVDKKGRFWASAYYWCDEHEPWQVSGISDKLPVHFDVIREFRFDEPGQLEIFRKVKGALGIRKGTRITEEMAINFFETCPSPTPLLNPDPNPDRHGEGRSRLDCDQEFREAENPGLFCFDSTVFPTCRARRGDLRRVLAAPTLTNNNAGYSFSANQLHLRRWGFLGLRHPSRWSREAR